MRRRFFMFLPFTAAGATSASAVGNSFASLYNEWAAIRNARQDHGDVISAPEMLRWPQVKDAWRKFEKRIDAEYRGELRTCR